MDPENVEHDAEAASLLSTKPAKPSPDTLTKLIRRIRALTCKLLPVQVELDEISKVTSRIITPNVVSAYSQAAGDFGDALPYCLLRARQTFVWDANHNAADFGEHMGRAIACEVLARLIIHNSPPENLHSLMSTHFRYQEWDGDTSNLSSALELAIDQHCTIFLSSHESQQVINEIWSGEWVQYHIEERDIDYIPYEQTIYQKACKSSFWRHLDPSRLSVPCYQNIFRITVWIFFLFIYSQAVQSPLEKKVPGYPFEVTEATLYTMAFSFSLEESWNLYRTLRYITWRALGFWNVVSVTTDGLLITALVFRILGLALPNDPRSDHWHLLSFQVLSCVAPLIWMKLVTVIDGFKMIGTMEICISRMFRESTIFFLLLTILMAGFVQAMYALDAADGFADNLGYVVNNLLQALMQSPNFDAPSGPFNLVIYYFWCTCTTIILLNVLISLFASAYDDVVQDAEAHYLAFFAGKTLGMIRSPDSFVYPAPFNLIETFLVAPLEWIIPLASYDRLNRFLMRTLFFIPLILIALYETFLDPRANKFTKAWFEADEGYEDEPECQNPSVLLNEQEGEISKVPFDKLVKAFPNTAISVEAAIVLEIKTLKERMEYLISKIERMESK